MSKLALFGGDPVRKKPPPRWPIFDEKEAEAAARVARSGHWQYGRGSEGEELEAMFSEWTGATYAVSTINGTETMTLALKAAGIGPGDEVIMPTFTFVACPLSVLLAGAVPVPVDIDPANSSICPEATRAAITDRTRALMPVHLHGVLADMDAMMAIASGARSRRTRRRGTGPGIGMARKKGGHDRPLRIIQLPDRQNHGRRRRRDDHHRRQSVGRPLPIVSTVRQPPGRGRTHLDGHRRQLPDE